MQIIFPIFESESGFNPEGKCMETLRTVSEITQPSVQQ